MPDQLSLFADSGADAGTADPRRIALLEQRVIDYTLVRTRRRSLLVSVDAQGVTVRAPQRAPLREIDAFLVAKRRWILERLDEWAGIPCAAEVTGASGETVPLYGEALTLQVMAGRPVVRRDGEILTIFTPTPEHRARVRRKLVLWLKAQALAALSPRAHEFARLLGLTVAGVRLSSARHQWGVCTQSGQIRLSWRLVHVAPPLADYVVAHEVAHLAELNHSQRFWRVVESLYPDWRRARAELDRAARAIPTIRG